MGGNRPAISGPQPRQGRVLIVTARLSGPTPPTSATTFRSSWTSPRWPHRSKGEVEAGRCHGHAARYAGEQ